MSIDFGAELYEEPIVSKTLLSEDTDVYKRQATSSVWRRA